MNCFNQFCIYQEDDKCLLKTIDLDVNGICQSCIYVEIPPQILKYEKDELKRKFAMQDGIL